MKNLLRKLSYNGIIYPLIFELAWGVGVLSIIFLYSDLYYSLFMGIGILILIFIFMLSVVVVVFAPVKRTIPTLIFWTIELIITFISFFIPFDGFLNYVLFLSLFVIPAFMVLKYFSLFICLVLIAIPTARLIRQKHKEKWENYHSE